MDLLKKYWRIIVFGVVCLLSIGAGAWAFIAGSDIEEKVAAVDRVRSAVENARRNPVNRAVIESKLKQIEAENARFETAMNTALALQKYNAFESQPGPDGALNLVERKTLIPDVLPAPASAADAIAFRVAYERAFERLAARLKGRDKPSAAEVREYWEQWIRIHEGGADPLADPWREAFLSAAGGAKSMGSADDRNLEDVLRVYPRALLAEEIARSIYMYIDDGAIGKDGIVRGRDAPTAVDIWHAQMSLWIQQDLVLALARCNERRAEELRRAGATDKQWVAFMPVKRLIQLSIGDNLGQGGGSNAQSGFNPSFTKFSNDAKRFVVPVRLKLVIEEASLIKVVDEVCRAGFYTPVSVTYRTVDVNPLQEEYVYGDAPLIEASLEFEGYFFRKVFDQWIPKELAPVMSKPGAKDSKGR